MNSILNTLRLAFEAVVIFTFVLVAAPICRGERYAVNFSNTSRTGDY